MRTSDDQRYTLGELLGKGALATVVAVTGPKGQRYAGKLLHNSQSQDASAVARFLQEAALLRSLTHVNIVRVIETATVGGQPMLVMERIDGPTLAQLIARDAPLPERLLLAIGRGIAEGLAYAHAHGVIHRDLKPGNVLLQANEPAPIAKIGDFGMARASSLAGVDHRAMTVVGTPDYMAPESVDPLAVDLRSDLYALGCILYEMACGRPPFDAATPLGLLHQHRTAPIPALPDHISPDLRRLIERLLAKSPGERPQAAEAVIKRLDQILSGDRPQALATTPTTVDETGPRCSACGEPLLPELKLCLACG
ncbi:MAG TPA: serine/threonine protein kinase, partial [Nannocystis exedens]|nr:serine/threonine protein kinase [Nannocystis exedens]